MIGLTLYLLGVAHMYLWLVEDSYLQWPRPRWLALVIALAWPVWTALGFYDHIRQRRKDK